MTFNAAGNIRSSASLAAAATATYDVDYSTKLEGQVTVKNTPGGTIASTRGVAVQVYARYSSAPSVATIASQTLMLPSAVASTAESTTLYLATGKYRIAVTNTDGTNAVTVEITGDTVDSMS